MSGNVWNRPSGSFMVDMGISSNIMKSHSPKCYMTFWDMVIYSDTLNWSNITPIFEPITELDLITNFDHITKFREVSIEHCNGCGKPTEVAYSYGHLVLSHLGLAFVLMLRPFFPELVMSTDFWFSNIPRYSYFACRKRSHCYWLSKWSETLQSSYWHTHSTYVALSNDTKVNDLVTLWLIFMLK